MLSSFHMLLWLASPLITGNFIGVTASADTVPRLTPSDGCVLLTGANGFLAGHLTEELLRRGYTVHGTVRGSTLRKKEGLQHLYDLEKKYSSTGGSIELFECEDIANTTALYDAARGCSAILSTAFPIPKGVEDKNNTDAAFFEYQISKGEGASLAVMEVADRLNEERRASSGPATAPVRVVVTSSIMALLPTLEKRDYQLGDAPYNESDWNTEARLGFMNYNYAKMRAEKAAYEYLDGKKGSSQTLLGSVLFAFAVGFPHSAAYSPTGSHSTYDLFSQFLRTDMLGPFYLPFQFHAVQVGDVARGHVEVMERLGTNSDDVPTNKIEGRYIVAPPKVEKAFVTAKGMHEIFRSEFGGRYRVPPFQIPVFLMKLLFTDSGTVDMLMTAGANGVDGTKITGELGFAYKHTDMAEAIVELGREMIERGLVQPQAPYNATLMAAGFFGGLFVAILFFVFAVRAVATKLFRWGGKASGKLAKAGELKRVGESPSANGRKKKNE